MTELAVAPELLRRRQAGAHAEEALLDWRLPDTPSPMEVSPPPKWARAHLVAHLIGYALRLTNRLRRERTGIEAPMHATLDARSHEVEEWLVEPKRALLTRLPQTRDHWAGELDVMMADV